MSEFVVTRVVVTDSCPDDQTPGKLVGVVVEVQHVRGESDPCLLRVRVPSLTVSAKHARMIQGLVHSTERLKLSVVPRLLEEGKLRTLSARVLDGSEHPWCFMFTLGPDDVEEVRP